MWKYCMTSFMEGSLLSIQNAASVRLSVRSGWYLFNSGLPGEKGVTNVTTCNQGTFCDQLWPGVISSPKGPTNSQGTYNASHYVFFLSSVNSCHQLWPSVTRSDQMWPGVTNCIMREGNDWLFGCELSEPSWEDRASPSKAQRSSVQQLVIDMPCHWAQNCVSFHGQDT